jgi:hypothetical protein
MRKAKWLLMPLFTWAMLAQNPAPKAAGSEPKVRLVLEFWTGLTFVEKGVGEAALTLPLQFSNGRTVDAIVRLPPGRANLLHLAPLFGVGLGKWRIVAGPTATRNIRSKPNLQQVSVVGIPVNYEVQVGQKWSWGGEVKAVRMFNSVVGLFGDFHQFSYPIGIVASDISGVRFDDAQTKQRMQRLLLGPQFQFGHIGLMVGGGATYGKTIGQYAYPGKWERTFGGGVFYSFGKP